MITWIHISELKSTVVIGDSTYAPSDNPEDCKPMPEELIAYLESIEPKTAVVEAQALPMVAPETTKKG